MLKSEVEIGKTYLVTGSIGPESQLHTAAFGPVTITVKTKKAFSAVGVVRAVVSQGWDSEARLVAQTFDNIKVTYSFLSEVPRGSIPATQDALVALDAWVTKHELPVVLKASSELGSNDVLLYIPSTELIELARKLDLPSDDD